MLKDNNVDHPRNKMYQPPLVDDRMIYSVSSGNSLLPVQKLRLLGITVSSALSWRTSHLSSPKKPGLHKWHTVHRKVQRIFLSKCNSFPIRIVSKSWRILHMKMPSDLNIQFSQRRSGRALQPTFLASTDRASSVTRQHMAINLLWDRSQASCMI